MKKIQPKSTSFNPEEIVEGAAKKVREGKRTVRKAISRARRAGAKLIARGKRTAKKPAARRGRRSTGASR
jgi:hypothetical protein